MLHFGLAKMVIDGQEVGCLQDLSIDFSFEKSTLYCGAGIFPISVRIHSGSITGNASFADINAVLLSKVLGGIRTNSNINLTNTSKPPAFSLVIELVTDGVTIKFTFNQVRSSKLSMAFSRTEHLMPNFDYEIEAAPDGTVGLLEIGDVS
jgi:hypothetical protein